MNTEINEKSKRKENEEKRLKGLKRHREELNFIIKESLEYALMCLMREKDYESISISELCIRAGVSRTAFYNNFKTKDDVFKLIVYNLNKEINLRIGSPFRETTSYEWYLNFFKFVEEKADIIQLIFDAGFQHQYMQLLNQIVLHNENTPINKKYQRLIWTGAIENVIEYWITQGKKETIEELANFCNDNMVAWSYAIEKAE